MKLMIVGGGEAQLNAIKRARSLGNTVIVSDINPECPGALEADTFIKANTFSFEETYMAASVADIDAIFTLGTDQPVLPVTKTALELDLASCISVETALAVTNKRVMKPLFVQNGIPTCKFALISRASIIEDLNGFNYPLVIKPVDSQGQRGVYKVRNWDELKKFLPDVLSYSREDKILVEEFYLSDEITISAWSLDGQLYPLTITDRVCITNGPHIGICTSHEYPSRYMDKYKDEIISISENIVSSFSITNGPVYIQMLIGEEGIRVNEVAARIGGAYEDELIPAICGVDILKLQFDFVLTGKTDIRFLKNYKFPSKLTGSVILFFTNPGIVKSNGDMSLVKNLPGVIAGKYLLVPGTSVGNRENSTSRAGYVLMKTKSRSELDNLKKKIYSLLDVRDINGENLLCDF
jgi:biotin carboxylase